MPNGRAWLLDHMQAVAAARAGTCAVREASRDVTYRDFSGMVGAARLALQAHDPDALSPVGLLLDRSAQAYAGMWAAIAEGRAYVPLNPRYPASRLRAIIHSAGVKCVISDAATQDLAENLGFDAGSILVPDSAVETAPDGPDAWLPRTNAGETAYILFTSGSTGQPKGVPISYDNLSAFARNMMATIPYPPDSVCSQVCELSFDFSVHEIYQSLLSGGTVVPARQIDLLNPALYIAKNAISVWISVPSLARIILANQTRAAAPLDSIQLSIFNGEPLTTQIAKDWQAATPEAALWNTYGPTECTVAVTTQLWSDHDDLSEIDVVSIGTPLPGCDVAILDKGRIIPLSPETGECKGELLLKTAQRFAGYVDPSIPPPFVTDDQAATYYKTGDRVLWRDNRIFHLGRLDHQVKIGGHRIELMEVEWQLRRALETDALAVVTYPKQHPTELVLFTEGAKGAPRLDGERLGLPAYMLPKRSLAVEALPVTAHGKLDRGALQSMLEEM